MSTFTRDRLFTELADALRNFPGREYSGEIDSKTLFFADLGFASIDAVVLGEMLEERYGRKLPFHELLAELGQHGASDLEIGEIADFLHRHLSGDGEV